jgi:hypothetical protein
MRSIAFAGEKKLADLAARAYEIDPARQAEVKRATAALLRANPQLAKLASVRRGTPILVPALSGVSITPEVKAIGEVSDALLKELQAGLTEAARRLNAGTKQEIEAAQETVRLAKARELTELIDRLAPGAKPQLAATAAAAQKEAKALEATLEQADAAFAQLKDDLADLQKRLG